MKHFIKILPIISIPLQLHFRRQIRDTLQELIIFLQSKSTKEEIMFGTDDTVSILFIVQSVKELEYFICLNYKTMYHQPYKKEPKKPQSNQESKRNQSAQKVNFIQKNRDLQNKKKTAQKSAINATIPKPSIKAPQKTIPQKVEHLQKVVDKLSKGTGNPELQKLLLEQIKGIKSELREIKQQIGLNPNQSTNKYRQQAPQEEEVEENIADLVPRQQPREVYNSNQNRVEVVQQENARNNGQRMHYQEHPQTNKQLIDIGKIQPYMKEFKLQGSKVLLPIYRGYHKKSSKPIVIKYCGENQTMDGLINLYEKLWKNIVKAKKVCINKIYDLNEPLATNIMALEMNKLSINEIELPPLQIVKQVFRGIQFFHQCGYLYRNIHPAHVMMSFQGNIVLLDLKLMRRFADMKGKLLQVRANEKDGANEFMSNARLRGIPQGRKDDLECLGYLALYLLQGRLPWNMANIMQVRSKVTLQNLYGNYQGLLQYMINIHKMSTQEMPNYDRLYSMITL